MKWIVDILTASIGGAIGWWLGDAVGMTTALVLSGVGTAAGLYFGRRFVRDYLG